MAPFSYKLPPMPATAKAPMVAPMALPPDPLPVSVSGTLFVTDVVVLKYNCALLVTVMAVVDATGTPLPTMREPPLMSSAPVTVLVPLSVRLPAPDLVKPPLPASTALTTAALLVTVIVGEPELTASVNGPPLPGLSVHLENVPVPLVLVYL